MKKRIIHLSFLAAAALLTMALLSVAYADSSKGFAGAENCSPIRIVNSEKPPLAALLLLQGRTKNTDDTGRLNHFDCQAPFALYLNEAGDIELWTTGIRPGVALTASQDDLLSALTRAIRSEEEVSVADSVLGFSLIARPDGSLSAEQGGVYRFDFYPSGARNTGYGIYQ